MRGLRSHGKDSLVGIGIYDWIPKPTLPCAALITGALQGVPPGGMFWPWSYHPSLQAAEHVSLCFRLSVGKLHAVTGHVCLEDAAPASAVGPGT